MKIEKGHFRFMVQEMRVLRDRFAIHRRELQKDARVRDIEKRMRWDVFHAAGLTRFACDVLYQYANDENIDTALRAAMLEIEGGEII